MLTHTTRRIRELHDNTFFAISKPMIGSIITGELKRVRTTLANYPDHSKEERIKHRDAKDPVQAFPEMSQEHGDNHGCSGTLGCYPTDFIAISMF